MLLQRRSVHIEFVLTHSLAKIIKSTKVQTLGKLRMRGTAN